MPVKEEVLPGLNEPLSDHITGLTVSLYPYSASSLKPNLSKQVTKYLNLVIMLIKQCSYHHNNVSTSSRNKT